MIAKAGINDVAILILTRDLGHKKAKQQAMLASTNVDVGRINVHSIQNMVTNSMGYRCNRIASGVSMRKGNPPIKTLK